MYNLTQLTKYSEKFLMDNYGLRLEIPIELNARMKRTCGWFRSSRNRVNGNKKAICIQLNKYFVENNEPLTVLDVLRHELIHYALFAQEKPNSDGHPVFEAELKRLKVVSQSTIDKYNIASKPIRVSFSIYECRDCGNEYKTKRALPNEGRNHRCKCKGTLISKGKQVASA